MSTLYYVVKINSVDKFLFERKMNSADEVQNYFESDASSWNDSLEVYDNEYDNEE